MTVYNIVPKQIYKKGGQFVCCATSVLIHHAGGHVCRGAIRWHDAIQLFKKLHSLFKIIWKEMSLLNNLQHE